MRGKLESWMPHSTNYKQCQLQPAKWICHCQREEVITEDLQSRVQMHRHWYWVVVHNNRCHCLYTVFCYDSLDSLRPDHLRLQTFLLNLHILCVHVFLCFGLLRDWQGVPFFFPINSCNRLQSPYNSKLDKEDTFRISPPPKNIDIENNQSLSTQLLEFSGGLCQYLTDLSLLAPLSNRLWAPGTFRGKDRWQVSDLLCSLSVCGHKDTESALLSFTAAEKDMHIGYKYSKEPNMLTAIFAVLFCIRSQMSI